MRLLITGASGLLGLNIALEASRQHQVYGVVNATPVRTDAFHVLHTDLCQPGAIEQVLAQVQPEWVIHCAALANLETCERDPELARQINADVPEKLAKLVARGGARQEPVRFLHVSTDAVFDGRKGNYSETDLPNPINVYSRTKLEGEQAVLNSNPGAIVARVNLFGFSPTGKRSLAEFFLNNMLVGNRVKGFTDVYFCPLLVNRVGEIFIKMLSLGLSGLYHVFSSECLSKYEFGVRIARRFNLDPDLVQPTSVSAGGLLAARAPNLTMQTHKLSTALGESLPGISTMLDEFYTLYQHGYPQRLIKMATPGE